MSGVATAKSLEGMVIGMGLAIGVLQYVTMEEIHEGWIRNCVQNRSLYTLYGGITHQKQQISEKGDAAEQYYFSDICCFNVSCHR